MCAWHKGAYITKDFVRSDEPAPFSLHVWPQLIVEQPSPTLATHCGCFIPCRRKDGCYPFRKIFIDFYLR